MIAIITIVYYMHLLNILRVLKKKVLKILFIEGWFKTFVDSIWALIDKIAFHKYTLKNNFNRFKV